MTSLLAWFVMEAIMSTNFFTRKTFRPSMQKAG